MISKSPQETQKLASEFAKKLDERVIITLQGELGAGKTNFIQGLAAGLGIERRVLSPTFVFLRSYQVSGKPFSVFHHVDLYRAETVEGAKSTGIEEILNDKEALVAIEWPEVIEKLIPKENVVRIEFKKLSESEREIKIN